MEVYLGTVDITRNKTVCKHNLRKEDLIFALNSHLWFLAMNDWGYENYKI